MINTVTLNLTAIQFTVLQQAIDVAGTHLQQTLAEMQSQAKAQIEAAKLQETSEK